MKELIRSRKRIVLLACLAIGVGWFAWTEVSAEPATAKDSVTIDAAELRRELSDEQQRHTAAVATLKKARAALKVAKVDTKVIDGLIAAENADHGRRAKRLTAWLDSASAQTDDDASRTRSIIDRELRDFAKAIGSLNQSIRISPISSGTARTGGSRFADTQDDPDYQSEQGEEPNADRQPGGDDLKGDRQLGESTRLDRLQKQVEELTRQLAAIRQQLRKSEVGNRKSE